MPDADASFIELGRSGLRQRGGRIYEEFLPQLYGDRAIRIYREMGDNDPIVGACLLGLRMYMRKIIWHAEPGDREASDEDVELLESCINDMSQPFSQFVSEALSFLQYGWSYFEIVYKRRDGEDVDPPSQYDDGKIGWRKWAFRSQDTRKRWILDEHGGIHGLVQQLDEIGNREKPIPIEKAMLFRTEANKNNPEGRSCLRNAYRPWWFKKRIEESEAIGIDRDLTGLPVVDVPPEWMTDTKYAAQLAKAERMARDVRVDEQAGLVLPAIYDPELKVRLMDFRLLASPGVRVQNVGEVIGRKNQEITLAFMADVILLGHEKIGTQALAREKKSMLTESLNAWAQEIADVVNKYAVPRLWKLNGLDPKKAPRLTFDRLGDIPLGELADLIAKLAGAEKYLVGEEELETAVRRIAGLPDVPEGRDEARHEYAVKNAELEKETREAAGLPDPKEVLDARGAPPPKPAPGRHPTAGNRSGNPTGRRKPPQP